MSAANFLTIVGFRRPAAPDESTLAAALKRLDPQRTYELRPVPPEEGSGMAVLLAEAEGVQFTIVARNEKVRAADFASAVASGQLTWKEAGPAVAQAGAQIIIAANRPAGDHQAAVKIAFLLTTLTASAASAASAAGPAFIYWGTADLLVEPAAFAAAVEAMLGENRPPVLQWVNFTLFRGPDAPAGPTGGMRSKGLAPFIDFELQLDPVAMTPIEIARRAIGYAEHLVREGPVEDREIDGPGPGERIALSKEGAPGAALLRMRVLDEPDPRPLVR